MKHHPLTDRYARYSLDVLHSILRDRFAELETFLDRVGWKKEDLDAWLTDPEDNLLLEAVTFLLTSLAIGGESDLGPTLPGMGGTESERDYQVSKRRSEQVVREVDTSRDRSPFGLESEVSETTLGEESTSPARLLLSLLRAAKLALLDAGALEWDDVLDDHKKMEETYRLSRRRLS